MLKRGYRKVSRGGGRGGSSFRPGWVQQSFTIACKIEGGPDPLFPPLDPRMMLVFGFEPNVSL